MALVIAMSTVPLARKIEEKLNFKIVFALAYVIAIVIGLGGGGGTQLILGVILTFLLVQFVDSYIFQPLVLGNKIER